MSDDTAGTLVVVALLAVLGFALYNGDGAQKATVAVRPTVAMPTDPESQAKIFAAARENGRRAWKSKTKDETVS
jgi:hypothetical protein